MEYRKRNVMRIIAGSARRTQLLVADDSPTRPFLEMARGALFNSLGSAVNGAAVLDLYAGSGALGLEALSRGAASCVFVERDAKAHAALRRNIEKCGFSARSKALRALVETAASGIAGTFDLIFADPPFPVATAWDGSGKMSHDIAGLLAPAGVLCFRLEDAKTAPPDWTGLALRRDKRYGRSRICFYVRRDSGPKEPSGDDRNAVAQNQRPVEENRRPREEARRLRNERGGPEL